MFPLPRIEGRAVLGIDPGTHLGYGLHDRDCTVRSGTLDLPDLRIGTPMRGKKTEMLRQFLDRIAYEALGLDAVYFELSIFAGRGQGALSLMDRGGIADTIASWCYGKGIPCEGIPPATVKKFATGNGNASKKDLKFIVQGWGFDPKTLDEADALAVMAYGLEMESQKPRAPEFCDA